MDDEQRERFDLYARTREDLLKRNLSNSENMDRSILSLSSALLGLSIGMTKTVVDLKAACYLPLLFSSWWLFAIAIISTLVSFLASQQAIKRQLVLADEYYLKGNDSALEYPNRWANATEWINILSAAAFNLAIAATIFFFVPNIGTR